MTMGKLLMQNLKLLDADQLLHQVLWLQNGSKGSKLVQKLLSEPFDIHLSSACGILIILLQT